MRGLRSTYALKAKEMNNAIASLLRKNEKLKLENLWPKRENKALKEKLKCQ